LSNLHAFPIQKNPQFFNKRKPIISMYNALGKRGTLKKHHMLKRGGTPNVERHMVDQVFQNELRELKDKCCVHMTFLSCYRLTSVCKYFCLYFIGRFAKIYL